MSAIVQSLTPFTNKEVLLEALNSLEVGCREINNEILTERGDYFGNQRFVWHNNQYYFQYDSDEQAIHLQQNFKEWKSSDSFLKAVEERYVKLYQLKLHQLGESEKQKEEQKKKEYILEQEKKIQEKAKALGYKVEKRVEKDNTVQFVLVKRNL
jgi:hypothetical protein